MPSSNKFLSNFHSHTFFCDGTDDPYVYAQKAIELGLKAYGFSSHAPVPFETLWAMLPENFNSYKTLVLKNKRMYQNEIEIYLGLEVDFIEGRMGPGDAVYKEMGLDYTIGSVHFGGYYADGTPWEIDGPNLKFEKGLKEIFDGNIKDAVKEYFRLTRKMLSESKPDILGHMDKIKMQNHFNDYFDESEKWYKNEVLATLDVAAETGVIVEVNTRGLYKKRTSETYPSSWVIAEMKKRNIPVIINSDCHHPKEMILGFDVAEKMILKAGYKSVKCLVEGEWRDMQIEFGV